MKTIKLHIRKLSDKTLVEQAQKDYSNAFMLMYKTLDESSDPAFVSRFKERFNLTDIGYRSLVADVKSARNQDITNDNERKERIAKLQDDLSECESWEKPAIQRKIARIQRRVGKERTFGGIGLLRQISRECNKSERDEERLARLREEYRGKRVKPVFVMGEANQSGNRFFDVTELGKGRCRYKPRKGVSCDIEFKAANRKDLELVSRLAKSKDLPVTVSLTTEYICISYDELSANGFGIDERQRRSEVKAVKKLSLPKEEEAGRIKAVYREHYEYQRDRMQKGKIPGRCISVDINPTNIGWSVSDAKDGCESEVVACGWYDYLWLCRKLHKDSSSAEQKKLNNKRRHELKHIVRALFRTAKHHGCSMFVMEELSFDRDEKMSREANRKNRNVWCRELFVRLVERRCNESGIRVETVNPCYSSFIGNIRYGFVDATNASIEIGRRGLHKYENGALMPDMRDEDLSTLEAKFGEDATVVGRHGWVKAYNALTESFGRKEFAYRLRTALEAALPHETFSMDTCRSGVNSTIFTKLH